MLPVMTVVFAILKARPEYADEVEHQLRELVRLTREEPGALGYAVYRQPGGGFLVHERYADERAREAHFAAPYVTAFLAATERLLVAAPQVEMGVELDGFHRG